MPFDSLNVPPEWMPPRRESEPERPLSVKDRVFAVAIGFVLAVITLANCKAVLGVWHGW